MTGTDHRATRASFVVAILSGSLLLFMVQPMIARLALPRLGGTPAVWNSAMLVYQALLLGGYAYAHWLGRVAPRRQAAIHLALLLLAALWLPIGLADMQLPVSAEPALWVPYLLLASIGPPFLVLSAQAPLLQRWFAVATGGADPYALYAASNVGSFVGLLAYPLLVEPGLGAAAQSWAWSAGYLSVVVLIAVCAWQLPRGAAAASSSTGGVAPIGRRRIAHWVVLSLVPSGLMLATTTYITTDILAMPLLWVIPLGLYLLSFSVAFAARRWVADTLTTVAPLTILLFGGVMMGGFQAKPYLNAALALAMLFMAAVALHTALYRSRPEPERLTGFYLAMSVGGALGGVFAGLIAPVVFDWTWEFPILVLAAGLLAPQRAVVDQLAILWVPGTRRRFAISLLIVAVLAVVMVLTVKVGGRFATEQIGLVYAALAILAVIVLGRRALYAATLVATLFAFGGYRSLTMTLRGDERTRSYFGVYAIDEAYGMRRLAHGTTIHGTQSTDPARATVPTTYYAPRSGVGQALRLTDALYGPGARIGAVGLGTGTLACYARPGQRWRFFEIDPTVVQLARDDGRFSFLSRCLPNPTVVVGDARLRLAQQPSGSLDVLILDAFSSDSIPMHLMTAEAFADYRRVLSPRGLLLVHISNRFMDLTPVVSAAAVGGGWQGAGSSYRPGALDVADGAAPSTWIALSPDRATVLRLTQAGSGWAGLPRYPGFAPWTDDYGSILPLLDYR